jgi:spore coat protein U-like protein
MSRFLHRAALACAAVAVTVVPLASPASAVGTRQTVTLSCSMGQTEAVFFKNTETVPTEFHDFTVIEPNTNAVVATSGRVAGGASAPVVLTSALPQGQYQVRDLSGAARGDALANGTLTIGAIDPNPYSLTAC